jgi:hypothetical protein
MRKTVILFGGGIQFRKAIFLLVFMTNIVFANDGTQSIKPESNLTTQNSQRIQAVQTWDDVKFPKIPNNFSWKVLHSINAAVVTPEDWKHYYKEGNTYKVFAFTGDSLAKNGFFETGLTVRLRWLPNAVKNDETKTVNIILASILQSIKTNANNKVIFAKLEKQNSKTVLIIRHENSPQNMTPIIVHSVCIGDPVTGNVYEFIFEAPKAIWDEKWKTGEQIFSKLFVLW